ncbi:MAG: hypothetical protein RLY86_4446 [Pseudomonadota bacterium]|jgi:hypothetical protein
MSDAANTAGNRPVLPLFYTRPVPVTLDRHRDMKIRSKRHFGYAASAHAVPCIVDEVPLLQGYYPIVFTPGDNPAMVAILGLRPDQSLMVKRDGSWRAGWPMPAYILRYPFILVKVPNEDRMILVMEEDANVVSSEGDQPLFEGGKGTKYGEDVLNYCAAFNRAVEDTQALCKELHDRGLLIDQRADMTTADRKQLSLTGFRVIDEQKFNALPDEVFLEWRRKGWIGIVYAHLLSLGRWGGLLDLVKEVDAEASAA